MKIKVTAPKELKEISDFTGTTIPGFKLNSERELTSLLNAFEKM